jgi:O-antigen ligase
LRWLLWAVFLGFSLAYWLDPARYVDQFGHLRLWVETVMFGLPVAAVFVGLMEMMTREKAGVLRAPPPAIER